MPGDAAWQTTDLKEDNLEFAGKLIYESDQNAADASFVISTGLFK